MDFRTSVDPSRRPGFASAREGARLRVVVTASIRRPLLNWSALEQVPEAIGSPSRTKPECVRKQSGSENVITIKDWEGPQLRRRKAQENSGFERCRSAGLSRDPVWQPVTPLNSTGAGKVPRYIASGVDSFISLPVFSVSPVPLW